MLPRLQTLGVAMFNFLDFGLSNSLGIRHYIGPLRGALPIPTFRYFQS